MCLGVFWWFFPIISFSFPSWTILPPTVFQITAFIALAYRAAQMTIFFCFNHRTWKKYLGRETLSPSGMKVHPRTKRESNQFDTCFAPSSSSHSKLLPQLLLIRAVWLMKWLISKVMLIFEFSESESDMLPTYSLSNHEHWGQVGTLVDVETSLGCRIWDAENSEMNTAHSPITIWVPARFILAGGA